MSVTGSGSYQRTNSQNESIHKGGSEGTFSEEGVIIKKVKDSKRYRRGYELLKDTATSLNITLAPKKRKTESKAVPTTLSAFPTRIDDAEIFIPQWPKTVKKRRGRRLPKKKARTILDLCKDKMENGAGQIADLFLTRDCPADIRESLNKRFQRLYNQKRMDTRAIHLAVAKFTKDIGREFLTSIAKESIDIAERINEEKKQRRNEKTNITHSLTDKLRFERGVEQQRLHITEPNEDVKNVVEFVNQNMTQREKDTLTRRLLTNRDSFLTYKDLPRKLGKILHEMRINQNSLTERGVAYVKSYLSKKRKKDDPKETREKSLRHYNPGEIIYNDEFGRLEFTRSKATEYKEQGVIRAVIDKDGRYYMINEKFEIVSSKKTGKPISQAGAWLEKRTQKARGSKPAAETADSETLKNYKPGETINNEEFGLLQFTTSQAFQHKQYGFIRVAQAKNGHPYMLNEKLSVLKSKHTLRPLSYRGAIHGKIQQKNPIPSDAKKAEKQNPPSYPSKPFIFTAGISRPQPQDRAGPSKDPAPITSEDSEERSDNDDNSSGS